MTNTPFYASGLKFSCTRCSSCCRYDAGFVFLSEQDLEKLALRLGMDRESFSKTYCRWVMNWQGTDVLSLKEKSNKDCIFWDNGCSVYQARPLQCRAFPFWDSIVTSEQSWEIAASGCPGMNSGITHSGGEINEYIKLRIKEPVINKKTFNALNKPKETNK
jgi:Fe-S-cluster containining protein